MNNITQNKDLMKYFSLICLFLFIILIPFNVYGAEEDEQELKENEKIRNPFYDYRKDRVQETDSETKSEVITDTNDQIEEEKEVIEIKNKRIEPSFYWQGLILAGNQYKILLEFNNETHIMKTGDKLDGYRIINVDSDKITLSKDDYIYYLRMGRE